MENEAPKQGSDMDRREILCEKWQLTDLSTKVPKSRQYLTTTLRLVVLTVYKWGNE